MPNLYFNPYYALPVYSSSANTSEFPFDNGQVVIVQLQLGTPLVVTQDRKREEDLQTINAKMEVSLLPEGDELDDDGYYIVSEVYAPNQGTYLLHFPSDVNDRLQAVIIDGSLETSFPLEAGQIISTSLVVTHATHHQASASSNFSGEALLFPLGEKTDGLIRSEVELVE